MLLRKFSWLVTFIILITHLDAQTFSSRKGKIGNFEIGTITDFHIKIDGRCAVYFLDTSATVKPKKFVISSWKTAFFSIQGSHEYVYLKQKSSKKLSDSTFKEEFEGNGFIATLTTRRINPITLSRNEHEGTLIIKSKSQSKIIKVKGYVDY